LFFVLSKPLRLSKRDDWKWSAQVTFLIHDVD
jgi:hypothetical protein